MPRVQANGIRVNYELSGNGEQAVALVHGLSDSLEEWAHQVPALEPRFRVLRYDIRGHHGTESGEAHGTIAQLARDLRELMRVLDIPRAHLVGFSMGGVIVQRFALDYPDTAESAVLLGSSSVVNRRAYDWFMERVRAVEEGGLAALGDTSRSDAERCIIDPNSPAREEYVRIRTTSLSEVGGFASCCRAMASLYEHPLTDELGGIRCPTLVATAERDHHCPPRASEIIAGAIPGSRLVIMPRGGHCSHIEEPDQTNELLLGFLGSVGAVR